MIELYNFGGKNDRPCTHLPSLHIRQSSLRKCHLPKQNAHLLFNTKQKNIKIECIYLFKEIFDSNKRQTSHEPTESTQLDFKLGISYGRLHNRIEFGLVFGRSLKL